MPLGQAFAARLSAATRRFFQACLPLAALNYQLSTSEGSIRFPLIARTASRWNSESLRKIRS
jgi:hypothetical protein